jgi:hypothetical protein
LLFIWYIFPCFGKYYREKSGNPGGKNYNRKKSNVSKKTTLCQKGSQKLFSSLIIAPYGTPQLFPPISFYPGTYRLPNLKIIVGSSNKE